MLGSSISLVKARNTHISLQLYTLDDTCPQSEWTSIEMQLKEDMQIPVPKPFDLARFLAATMTFMSCVENAHVSFNDKIFMKIAKSRQVPSSIRVPKDMIPRSKEDTMHIKGLSVVSGLHVVFSAREAY